MDGVGAVRDVERAWAAPRGTVAPIVRDGVLDAKGVGDLIYVSNVIYVQIRRTWPAWDSAEDAGRWTYGGRGPGKLVQKLVPAYKGTKAN